MGWFNKKTPAEINAEIENLNREIEPLLKQRKVLIEETDSLRNVMQNQIINDRQTTATRLIAIQFQISNKTQLIEGKFNKIKTLQVRLRNLEKK